MTSIRPPFIIVHHDDNIYAQYRNQTPTEPECFDIRFGDDGGVTLKMSPAQAVRLFGALNMALQGRS